MWRYWRSVELKSYRSSRPRLRLKRDRHDRNFGGVFEIRIAILPALFEQKLYEIIFKLGQTVFGRGGRGRDFGLVRSVFEGLGQMEI